MMNKTILSLLIALAASVLSVSAYADTQTRIKSYSYNAQGLLYQETLLPNALSDCLQTTYQYDAFGNPKSVAASACVGASPPTLNSASVARVSTSDFGPDGHFPVRNANALQQAETQTHDYRFGALTSLTGPNLLTTQWVPDSFGRTTQEIRADGTSTSWLYKLCTEAGANCPDAIGGARSAWVLIEQSYASSAPGLTGTAPNAPEKRQFFDILNRLLRLQTQGFDGAGAAPTLVQDTQYNALGQVALQSNLHATTDAPVWTSYTYDALGRLTTETHPDTTAPGGQAITRYDYNGLSTTVTNAGGRTKVTTKNAQGQVASVTDALGSQITYSYGATGNLLSTNAAGSITTLQYDQRERKIAMQDPAMGNWTYSYNAFGELVSQTDSLSQTTTMAYDPLGRMTQRLEPDLNSQWSYDKSFDQTPCGKSIGKLCEAKAGNGYDRKHSYDGLGRLSSTATVLDNPAAPALVSQTYDNSGLMATKTWPSGLQARYSYSPLGYIKQINAGGTNGFTQSASYQVLGMDAAGHVTQHQMGNFVTTARTYDAYTQRLRTQSATTGGQAAGNVLTQSYTYDPVGNLRSRSDRSPGVGTVETFDYDQLNRVTLDVVGGVVSPPAIVETMYDARGNISYKSDVGRYWYDPARPNRISAVTLETAPGASIRLSGGRALSYMFDDSASHALSSNGATLGNGNLSYTVSHDVPNNIHTV